MRTMEGRRTPSLVRVLRLRASADVAEQDPWAGEDERWAAEDREEDEFRRLAEVLEEDDPLAPARAVIVGILLVVPLWLLVGGGAYALYRVLT